MAAPAPFPPAPAFAVHCGRRSAAAPSPRRRRAQLVNELLDVSRHPRRPTYEMADDAPLVLHKCAFPGLDFRLSEREWAPSRRGGGGGSPPGR